MKKYLAVLSMLLMMGVMSVSAQSDDYITPESVVMNYINMLNQHDYVTAYEIFHPQDVTYDEFVAGYADTELIVPYLGRLGAGAGSVYISTVLLGYQTDGTIESYYGYFRLSSGMNYVPPIDGYVLGDASFKLVKDGDALLNGTIADITYMEWDSEFVLPREVFAPSEMGTLQAQTVLDYFTLINEGDFATAYNQWVAVPNQEFRAPYNQFVSGYDDTAYVTVYAGHAETPPFSQQADYLNSYLRVILVAEHTDGEFVYYSGCYALGYLEDGSLGIVTGRLSLMEDVAIPTTEMISTTLYDIACASLF